MNGLLLQLALVVVLQSPDGQGPQVSAPPPVAAQDALSASQGQPPPAAPAAEPAPAAAPPDATAATAPAAEPAPAKEPKDHISGLFVAGVGAGVGVLGAALGALAGALTFVAAIPFPGGDTERNGFATSAVVGSVFCGLVGFALVVVGGALFAVSFM